MPTLANITPMANRPTATDREDCTHPEKLYKGLILVTDKKRLTEEEKEERKHCKPPGFAPEVDEEGKDRELCWSCGWRIRDQWYSSYQSHIRIFFTNRNTGMWEVGSKWLIRDRPNDFSLGNDFMTQEFLRNQPGLSFPLVKEMRLLSSPTDKVHITLMSRAQGVTLESIWHTLNKKRRDNYKNQLTDLLKQLRQFTSPVARRIDGSESER